MQAGAQGGALPQDSPGAAHSAVLQEILIPLLVVELEET